VRIQSQPIPFSPCDVTHIATQNACEAAGRIWYPSNRCENGKTQAQCTPSPLVWDSVRGVCYDSSKTSSTCAPPDIWGTIHNCQSFNQSSCTAPSFQWDTATSTCNAKSKAFCETFIASPTTPTTKSLTLELYRGNATTSVVSGNATIKENGELQNLLFTGFSTSSISQGRYKLKIKDSTSIYPPGHPDIVVDFVAHKIPSAIIW